ncbi:MAG: MXAN_6577-like cysteine-rich protein [Myxococcota bacterium]
MKQLTLVALGAVAVLTACPPTGVVCKAGTVPCGTGCIDSTSDRRNCGVCGTTCGEQQDCVDSQCRCRPGTTACPGGTCVSTDYDAENCGACGNKCGAGLVCDQGSCKSACSAGLSLCGASCVDVQGDEANCGACGVTCAQGQQCYSGRCDFPVVAACYWSGQVVGFDPSTGVKGPLSDVGSNPSALARVDATLLVADSTDRRLYAALPQASGAYALASTYTPTASVPNQVLVDRPYAYVVNAGAGTLLVLREGADAGVVTLDAGVAGALTLGTVTELPLGMNTFPQGVAKVGTTLWVPLYGGYGAEAADAGQELVKVDVSNPAAPTLAGRVSLKSLDLHPFDGGTPVARPWSITALGGQVYVALNNLNPDTYAPEGPGLLAKVDPANDGVSVIDLGAADCMNPQWVVPVGQRLAVSCGGRITYAPDFSVQAVTAAGVVLVEQDARVATWSRNGAADAGFLPMLPGRLAVTGSRVVVTDQNGGRVVTLEVSDAGLTAVGSDLALCPVSQTTGVANVSDVAAR